jgi:predicted MFS family arabinose efflux permease
MNSVLAIVSLGTFTASLSMRSMDPLLPQIVNEFNVDINTAALLNASFALAYALVQPFLGAAADLFGKTRLITISLIALALSLAAGGLAPTFPLIFATRILSGAAAGGVFSIGLGIAGDLVPVHQRQVAISRFLGSAMAGNLLGAAASGMIADIAGWRIVMGTLGLAVLISALTLAAALRTVKTNLADPIDAQALLASYRGLAGNRNALIGFSAVAIEGMTIFGLFPYVATLLAAQGETRLFIAGLVIGAFPVGGIVYSLTISRLLPWLGQRRVMIIGGILAAVHLILIGLGAAWQVQLALFILMALGFYMLHGSLQLFATELSPNARASATSLHAFFFFLGQGIGPIFYGNGIANFGVRPTLTIAACMMVTIAIASAFLMRRAAPEE